MLNLNKTAGRFIAFALPALVVTHCVNAEGGKGFSYNNLNVSPYVNAAYIYDSNVGYDRNNKRSDQILRVNPGVDVGYEGNEWGVRGNLWYSRDWYTDHSILDKNSYGEKFDVFHENSKGWRVLLGQSFIKSGQHDSIIDGGRGQWRDRQQWDFSGAVGYDFSERMTATLTGLYSDLDYANSSSRKYNSLYGWRQWMVGLELSRKLTAKSNVLLYGSYQNYKSDGALGVSSESHGYNLHAGFSSRATERITYRALTGVTWFDYAGDDIITGWTYSLDASWKISEKWAASAVGSSNFQPSEREANQAMQYYTLSAGVTYKPMRKLTTRLDMAYRREDNEYSSRRTGYNGSSANDDRYSIRVGADYELARYTKLYGSLEYEDQHSGDRYGDFDRWRATVGLNFRY